MVGISSRIDIYYGWLFIGSKFILVQRNGESVVSHVVMVQRNGESVVSHVVMVQCNGKSVVSHVVMVQHNEESVVYRILRGYSAFLLVQGSYITIVS